MLDADFAPPAALPRESCCSPDGPAGWDRAQCREEKVNDLPAAAGAPRAALPRESCCSPDGPAGWTRAQCREDAAFRSGNEPESSRVPRVAEAAGPAAVSPAAAGGRPREHPDEGEPPSAVRRRLAAAPRAFSPATPHGPAGPSALRRGGRLPRGTAKVAFGINDEVAITSFKAERALWTTVEDEITAEVTAGKGGPLPMAMELAAALMEPEPPVALAAPQAACPTVNLLEETVAISDDEAPGGSAGATSGGGRGPAVPETVAADASQDEVSNRYIARLDYFRAEELRDQGRRAFARFGRDSGVQIDGKLVHASHVVGMRGVYTFCTECGSHTSDRMPVRLTLPCRGPANDSAAKVVARLRRGDTPKSKRRWDGTFEADSKQARHC